jgi:exodeoxyribonuclease VIII
MSPDPAPQCFSRREPLAEYLARTDFVSSSALRRFLRTGRPPSEVLAPDQTPREASLGDALHALLLEPERFDETFLRLDADGKAPQGLALDSLMARTWLSPSECLALEAMRKAVLYCSRAPIARWLEQGEKELSIYWTDAQGERWKGRPDCLADDVILELKTTADVRTARFARTRHRFGYDLQAALYVEGVTRLTGRRPRFMYVAVETSRPHAVWVHELGAEELAGAAQRLHEARERFRRARAGEAPAAAAT